jgi:hypothetical protein
MNVIQRGSAAAILVAVFFSTSWVVGEAQEPVVPACVQTTDPGPDGAGARQTSLPSYVAGIAAVILGRVQSVEAGQPTARGDIRQSFGTFQVTDVLKGAPDLRQVTASTATFGGTFVLKPGQRYILFLSNEAPPVPERPGIPRFHIGGALCITDTNQTYSFTRSNKGKGLAATIMAGVLDPLDRLPLDDALAQIRKAIGTGK